MWRSLFGNGDELLKRSDRQRSGSSILLDDMSELFPSCDALLDREPEVEGCDRASGGVEEVQEQFSPKGGRFCKDASLFARSSEPGHVDRVRLEQDAEDELVSGD